MRRSSVLDEVMESRAKFLQSRPHRPRNRYPHLAQELRSLPHRSLEDDPNEVVRNCTQKAKMCAQGHVSRRFTRKKTA